MRKVVVYPISIGKFASQIYGGLFDLAANSEIELKIAMRPPPEIHERCDWGDPLNRRIVYVDLIDNQSEKIGICYDMLDGPEIIAPNALERCNVYFKRSYSSEFIHTTVDVWQKSHPELAKKIHPYGLNMPYSSPNSHSSVQRYITFSLATGYAQHHPLKTIRRAIRTAVLGETKLPDLPVVPPQAPSEPLIMFQTRLFDPSLHVQHDEVDQINKYRVQIVSALRREFGKQFMGGLIPNGYTSKRYPELLTNCDTRQAEYFDLVKKCQIAVFTRGIRQSTGWRYAELLAMSRCIVSEPLAYELPAPLLEGLNCLYFSNPDECLAACYQILGNPTLAEQMRTANHEYFERNVRPSSLIRNTLNAAARPWRARRAPHHSPRTFSTAPLLQLRDDRRP